VNTTRSRPRLVVSSDGRGVVGHAGARLLADLAEATGLEAAFSAALAPSRQRSGGHDPGRVAVDVAVMLADGGAAIADLAVLREQPELFGQVASLATAWRVLDGINAPALARLRAARAAAREFTLVPHRYAIRALSTPSAASSTIRARSTARTCPDAEAAIFANPLRTTSSSTTGTACARPTAHHRPSGSSSSDGS
jgi:hypothetical protein